MASEEAKGSNQDDDHNDPQHRATADGGISPGGRSTALWIIARLGFEPITRKRAPQAQRTSLPSTRSDASWDPPHDGQVTFKSMGTPSGSPALIGF